MHSLYWSSGSVATAYIKKTEETKQQRCMYLGLACLPVTIHVFDFILADKKKSVNNLSMRNRKQIVNR